MHSHSIKVLIVAPNASSIFGGEAFLPLKYFQILRRQGYAVRLIAHCRNRMNLEEMFSKEKDLIYYIEDSFYHRAIWKIGRLFPSLIRSAIFDTAFNIVNEIFQSGLIKELIGEGLVDIIHQPIPVSPKAPSSLYGFGVPVIIGPMNGGMTFPPGYEEFESRMTSRFLFLARKVAVLVNRMVPGKQKAAALLVANERTRAALPVKNHPNVIKLVENGVDLSVWKSVSAKRYYRAREEFRLAFMGRLIALKAVDITLEVLRLAREKGVNVTLDILGDGEELPRLKGVAQSLGLGSSVRFLGFRSQAECVSILDNADAFILNSLRECGGAVVLEAMSLGLPVIASDWGGPADYIDCTCGILVSPVPRDTFAERLAEAVLKLAQDRELCKKMGRAGSGKIHAEYDWEKKVNRMVDVYWEVLDRSSNTKLKFSGLA